MKFILALSISLFILVVILANIFLASISDVRLDDMVLSGMQLICGAADVRLQC